MSLSITDITCSAVFVISWSEDRGFVTKTLKDDLYLEETELRQITRAAVPSGSRWRKYRGFRSIRIHEEQVKTIATYVLSVSEIRSEHHPHAGAKTVPETSIYILTRNDMQRLYEKGWEWLLKHIYEDNEEKPWEEMPTSQIPSISGLYKYVTIDNKSGMINSEAWKFIEASFLREFFQLWPEQTISIATLCTSEDRIETFQLVGMSHEDLGTFSSGKLSTIIISPDGNLSIHASSRSSFITSFILKILKLQIPIPIFLLILLVVISVFVSYSIGHNVGYKKGYEIGSKKE